MSRWVRLIEVKEKNNRRAAYGFWTLALLGSLSLGALFLPYRFERPMLDYLDEYKVLHYLQDQRTGKIIELGVLSNFGSTEYEVGVYEKVDSARSKFALRRQNISIVGYPGPVPELVQFDGKCYFVTVSEFREDWDKVRSIWKDEISGEEICFYVLEPGGKMTGDHPT